MNNTKSKSVLVIMLVLFVLSLSICIIQWRIQNYRKQHVEKIPSTESPTVNLIYALASVDKTRNITLLDFDGSVIFYNMAPSGEYYAFTKEVSSTQLEDGRWALSEKIPDDKDSVLIHVKGTHLSELGKSASFTL